MPGLQEVVEKYPASQDRGMPKLMGENAELRHRLVIYRNLPMPPSPPRHPPHAPYSICGGYPGKTRPLPNLM